MPSSGGSPEFWRAGGPDTLRRPPGSVEAEGWDGQVFMDSQSLGADPYVQMGYWAARTEHLKLAPGVTNPLTRHPAVTAAAVAGLQVLSSGRATLGIGRGDSALAYLGYGPAPLELFERALTQLQRLLSGGEVPFGGDELTSRTGSSDLLSLGDRPRAARLGWLPLDLPKVPLDVAATGPRVIDIAARIAERVTFSVGAMPERLGWAIDRARRAAAGRVQPPSLGAQIVVVCHREPHLVHQTATRLALPLVRFQVLQGRLGGPTREGDAANYASVLRGYAMTKHSEFGADKLLGETVDFDFISRFAIVGTPEECAARILALAELGIEHFVIVGPGFYDDGERRASLFSKEVLPAVRDEARRTTIRTSGGGT